MAAAGGVPAQFTQPTRRKLQQVAAVSARGVNAWIASLSATAPFVGMVVDYAGLTLPSGWLLCDGSAVSRTTYSALFAALGVIWGAGDGSTTFNLPNLTDKFTRGTGAQSVGTSGGAASVTLTVDQLPAHGHTITDPGHFHAALRASSTNTAGADAGAAVAGNTASATTGITATDNTGSGTAVPIVPPYGVVQKLIKT